MGLNIAYRLSIALLELVRVILEAGKSWAKSACEKKEVEKNAEEKTKNLVKIKSSKRGRRYAAKKKKETKLLPETAE
jgi:hypothetical protein